MSYKKRAQKLYDDPLERRAYEVGYARGWAGMSREPAPNEGVDNRLFKSYPNAFSKGYWEGHGEKNNGGIQ